MTVSYLEIYNESVNDLIEPKGKNLEIRESISKGIHIVNLAEMEVKDVEQVLSYLHKGDETKIIAATKQNEVSSRSHTIFRINLQSKLKSEGDEKKPLYKVSQLNLVDLAGSEGASKT